MQSFSWLRSSLAAVTVLTLSVSSGPTASAEPYSVTGVFTYGADNVARAINSSGLVTGVKYPCCVDANPRGFRWMGSEQMFTSYPDQLIEFSLEAINTPGRVAGTGGFGEFYPESYRAVVGVGTEILDLGIANSQAHGLNIFSRVVGEQIVAGHTRGFVVDVGEVATTLGTLGGATSIAYAINDAGTVVGEAQLADGRSHAFLASGDYSSLVDLGTLGGANSVAYDINAAGVVVGAAQAADGVWYPTVFQSGTVQKLGSASGRARAINQGGVVVGTLGASGAFRAIGGVVRDLNSLIPSDSGWWLWEAHDINDAGQIVGRGDLVAGSHTYVRGFVLTLGTVGVSTPARAELAFRAQPNVTPNGARFVFGTSITTPARVELIDVSGRVLRRLEVAAGSSAIEWDGRDDIGRRLSPGFVIARATGEGWEARTRLFIVR
ncbi:MAG: hypothetical protein HOP12_06990 [Candidatus Eisenbacteria bacterium]|uniref:DUF3466 family protein n=1 Tax=Eiseniibacteriota bacterium TaxID=2212470 RepID=A0A849SXP0_UNCEI|nr:hypothetical protein [Candidatus Eisenbacteria bacterium]